MKRYTVTITPDDGAGAQTVVKLEVNGTIPRIKELRLTAADDASLSAAQLPAINLELLLAAIMPATASDAAAVASVADAPAPQLTSAPVDDEVAAPVVQAPRRTRAPRTRKETPVAAKPIPAKKTSAPKASAPKASAPKASGRKASAPKVSPPKAAPKKPAVGTRSQPASRRARAGAAAKPVVAAERAYRTTPDDFVSTYRQASTVAAIADVYDVPRHTAQAWINTARKRGLIPAARPRGRR